MRVQIFSSSDISVFSPLFPSWTGLAWCSDSTSYCLSLVNLSLIFWPRLDAVNLQILIYPLFWFNFSLFIFIFFFFFLVSHDTKTDLYSGVSNNPDLNLSQYEACWLFLNWASSLDSLFFLLMVWCAQERKKDINLDLFLYTTTTVFFWKYILWIPSLPNIPLCYFLGRENKVFKQTLQTEEWR